MCNVVVVDHIQEGKENEIPTVEQIEQEAGSKNVIESLGLDNEIHGFHYFSWLFGVLLSCISVGLIALIPQHNILYEPEYWYELMIYSAFWGQSMLVANVIMQCIHWANISYAKNWATFFIMVSIGAIECIIVMSIYNLIWTKYFKLYAPMPFTYYSNGTILFSVLEATLWFR